MSLNYLGHMGVNSGTRIVTLAFDTHAHVPTLPPSTEQKKATTFSLLTQKSLFSRT